MCLSVCVCETGGFNLNLSEAGVVSRQNKYHCCRGDTATVFMMSVDSACESNTTGIISAGVEQQPDKTHDNEIINPDVDTNTPGPSTTPAPSTTALSELGLLSVASGSVGNNNNQTSLQSLFRIPPQRIKKIAKPDPDIYSLSNVACEYAAVAGEVFCEMVYERAIGQAKGDKRKTVLYKDVAGVINGDSNMAVFLSQVVPVQVPYSSIKTERSNVDDDL